MVKKVDRKWQTQGGFSVVYKVGDIILFYKTEEDPKFKNGQYLEQDDALKSNPYKAMLYSVDNVPTDALVDLEFTWSVVK